MDKKTLANTIVVQTATIWETLCELYTPLVRYNEPKIVVSGRLWRTAGYCQQDSNTITLGYKFFIAKPEYYRYMFDMILPHEIIHQADFNLYGESEKKCGHGKNWCDIMVNYGLNAEAFHSMDITR